MAWRRRARPCGLYRWRRRRHAARADARRRDIGERSVLLCAGSNAGCRPPVGRVLALAASAQGLARPGRRRPGPALPAVEPVADRIGPPRPGLPLGARLAALS